MMRTCRSMRTEPGTSGPRGKEYRYFCGLFEDMIFSDLCLLRRRELNGKVGFSCAGCSKDILMHSRNGRIASSAARGLTGKKPFEVRRTA